jgi:peroxiredoxin family protein
MDASSTGGIAVDEKIRRVSIIVSKGTLDGVYPGLILANGARMEGIEAMLFFTFFGLEAVHKQKMHGIRVATVGNPAMHIPTWLGAIPGMSAMATGMMKKQMEALDIPPIPEFIEMIHDAGGRLFACKLAMDMFKFKREDLCPQVEDVLTVGQFYDKSAGAQIIFT